MLDEAPSAPAGVGSFAPGASGIDGGVLHPPQRGLLGAYIRSLSHGVPQELSVALVLLVLGGLTEGVGVLLLVPVLELAGVGAEGGTVGGLQATIVRAFDVVGVRPTLEVVLLAFAAVVGGRALLLRQQSVLTARMQQKFVLGLRGELFAAITRARWLFVAGSRGSDFTHALTTDMDRVNAGTGQVLVLASSVLTTLLYLGLAVLIAPVVTLVVLAAGIVLVVFTRGLTREIARNGAAISRAGRAVHSLIAEVLGGMKLIKSHGLERDVAAQFSRAAQAQSDSQLVAIRTLADAKVAFDIGWMLILVIVVYVAVTMFDTGIVELLFVLLLFARVMPRVAQAQQAYHAVASMLPSFANVMYLRVRAVAEVERSVGAPTPTRRATLERGLRLDGVGFGYRPEAADSLIIGLELEIPARRLTAIIGPSGSGKSTIADLLLGLLLPDQGRVLIDGTALDADNLGWWRSATAYVPQETFLFNDSVRANVAWGAPDATAGEIEGALDAARASDFVRALPEGMDTVVGDRGVRLSGGERQRLALARALLRRPALLVLDEAMSQLDAENERQILVDVVALRDRTTVVLITHRATALESADLVHVVEAGKVVASGSWDSVRMSAPAVRHGLSS